MKLSLSLLASALGNRPRTDEDLNTVIYAHSMIRTAPLTDQYAKSLRQVESFSLDTLRSLEGERGSVSAADIAAIARNMTDPYSTSNERAVCASDNPYPDFDGKCNHPTGAGQPLQGYGRLLPASYCDSSGAPKCGTDKRPLPNPRGLSLYLRSKCPQSPNDKTTHFLNTAGQFITHTLLQTPDRSKDTRCRCTLNSSDCLKWSTGSDPVFSGVSCMFVTRSAVTLSDQDGQLVPEQINQLTGTLQAGNIYGFSEIHARSLRLPGSPFLETQDHTHGIYIPSIAQINAKDGSFKPITDKFRLPSGLNERGYDPLFSGDNRVLENPILGSWHIMYHRLHNILAQEIIDADPSLQSDSDFVFNEARKFNIAIMQKMVYEEMVPALFGNSLDKFDNGSLRPSNRPINQDHDRTGPVIFNEFATAAFRYGHSQQPETIVTKDGQYRVQSTDDIRDNFFDPHVLIQQGPAAICRGAATLQGLATGPAFGDSVLHNLFKPHGVDFGIDLFAINIARGRDHGLESHKKYLKKFKEDPECADLYRGWRGMRPEWNALVRDQYRNRDWEVDLYVGILMEKHLDGAAIGPTGACIIGKQFKTLKTQDRWFYENQEFWNDEAKFDQVKKIDLATTMCLTLGDTMKRVPDMPFIADGFPLDGKTRKMVNCNNLMNRLDLSEIYGEPEEPTNPPTEPPTETPTEPPRPENEPICDFDPVDRIVDCSNRGFDSMSLELMAERLRRTHAYPVDVNVHGGKERRQVKSDAVRIINLSGNPGLKSSDKGVFFLAIKEFNFARTLDIRNTNLNISKDEIHQNLPHIRQSFV